MLKDYLTEKTGKEIKLKITKTVRPNILLHCDGSCGSSTSKVTDIPED
jgi:hypothetical protein